MIGDDVVQKYGLSIARTSTTEPAYRLTGVEKLSGAENHGSSNIFVRVWTGSGARLDSPWLAEGEAWLARGRALVG